MIPATVLMFLVGIVKYGERTYSLYSGSVNGFRKKIVAPPNPGPNYAKLMTEFDAKEKAGHDVKIVFADSNEWKATDKGKQVLMVHKSLEAQAYSLFLMFRRLFVNLILSYKEQKISQAYFLDNDIMTPAKAFEVIKVELNFIYDMVYTKAPVAHTKAGCVFRFLGSACIVSSLIIFFFHGKDGFLTVDIAITYALLLGGLALDAVALLMLLCSQRMIVFLEETPRMAWLAKAVRSLRGLLLPGSQTTSHLNLINYCLGKPETYDSSFLPCCLGNPWVRQIFGTPWVREIFDGFFIRRERLYFRKYSGQEPVLLEFVFNSLKKRAMDAKGKDMDMNTICGRRGEGVLKDLSEKIMEMLKLVEEEGHPAEEKMKLLEGSVAARREFDESLLLWHIATDLCFYQLRDTAPTETIVNANLIAKTLSEYMLYLLIWQPEIMSATGGIGLIRYQDTRAEAQRFFESAEAVCSLDHDDARRILLAVNTSKEPTKVKGDLCKSVLFDGVILAKALRDLNEELRWEVINGVWGEMLTYAAGKCRGSTHVNQLSRGGELITMVWFLMAHMGLGDMYKIHEGDAGTNLIVRYLYHL